MTDINPYEPPRCEPESEESPDQRWPKLLPVGTLLILMFPTSFLAFFVTWSVACQMTDDVIMAIGGCAAIALLVAGVFILAMINESQQPRKPFAPEEGSAKLHD